MPLSTPCSKINQALPPINAINDLAEGLWVHGSIALTDYIVMGLPSMHLVGVGNGRGKKINWKAPQLSAYQRVDCPFVLSFAGYQIKYTCIWTVLGGASSWTTIFSKCTLMPGGAKRQKAGEIIVWIRQTSMEMEDSELYQGLMAPFWTWVHLVISPNYYLAIIIPIDKESKRRVTAQVTSQGRATAKGQNSASRSKLGSTLYSHGNTSSKLLKIYRKW